MLRTIRIASLVAAAVIAAVAGYLYYMREQP